MPDVLAITVGGSCAPLVTAIRAYRPEYVLFIVSARSLVMVNGKDRPCSCEASIVDQAGLPLEKYRILEVSDPDNLDVCYKEISSGLSEISRSHSEWRLLADYTGGTKTMTVALTFAALKTGWELSLVKGARNDLIKVINGTEMASLVPTWELKVQQRLSEACDLFNAYAYASAGELLESFLRSGVVNPDSENKIRTWVGLCRAFDAWDRFDHQRARQLMEPYQALVIPQWMSLKSLTGLAKDCGYEMVFDLLLNAERRAARSRFDDAVARLYRASELLAQTRLGDRTPPLNSSDLEVGLLPDEIRDKYAAMSQLQAAKGQKVKIMLALKEDYELLADLRDPVGLEYLSIKNEILDVLKKRNNSILAHGLSPLGKDDYEAMLRQVQRLVNNGLKALKIRRNAVQFPLLTMSGIEQR